MKLNRLLVAAAAFVALESTAFASEDAHGVEAEPAWWLIALFTLNGLVIWFFARRRYLVWKDGQLKPAFVELQEFSSYLLAGTIIAQLWVHGDPTSYAATIHAVLFHTAWFDLDVTAHFLVNDVFMTLFFGIAAKELVEATMKRDGALRGVKGLLPMMACLGGVIGPALVYQLICTKEMTGAWAIPCATDIAFAWLGARMIWGRTHPAVLFLLALAVADDFIGLGIIALFYPQRPFDFTGILLLGFAMGLAFGMNRLVTRVRMFRHWAVYLVPGVICWFGLLTAGLHSALALVFVVPFIPMAGRDAGIFMEIEHERQRDLRQLYLLRAFSRSHPRADHVHEAFSDPMNEFEHATKPFVDMGLFFFGLANAGVAWWGQSSWSQNSWAVFLGLGIGKTLGITVLTVLGYWILNCTRHGGALPRNQETGEQLQWRDVPIIGLLGAMGFTVALFVAEAASGHASLKLGAIASFAYLVVAVIIGKTILQRLRPNDRGSHPKTERP